MKGIYLVILTAMVLMGTASIVCAGVLFEDVAYWCNSPTGVQTLFDPTSNVLDPLVAQGNVLVKVQETVYDLASTQSMLARNKDASYPGYLYVYSLTNINVGNPSDPNDNGITKFAVNWGVAPLFVTTSHQTLPGWTVDTSSPTWTWTVATDAGLLPGETAGGFWAVSNIAVDGVATATVLHANSQGETISGQTTGPVSPIPDVPEPSAFLALMSGAIGLLGAVTRRR